ncbi:TPA: hypothetical protein ACSP16_003509 [Aeromonas veronii]
MALDKEGGGGGNSLIFTPVASPDGWGCPASSLFPLFCEFVRSPSYLWLVVMIGMVFRAREQLGDFAGIKFNMLFLKGNESKNGFIVRFLWFLDETVN